MFQISTFMPIIKASTMRLRCKVSAIHFSAHLPACYPPSPLEYCVLDVTRDLVELLNLATGSHTAAPIAAISHLSAFYA